MRAFSICTSDYLREAVFCLNSLPDDVEKTIWIADKIKPTLGEYEGILIRFVEDYLIGRNERNRINYDNFEYVCSLRPFISLIMLQEGQCDNILMYCDTDLCFYDDPSKIEFPVDKKFLIFPHFIEPPVGYQPNSELDINQAGLFNSGIFMLRACDQVFVILEWWDGHLQEKCQNKKQEGMFVDQIWLNYIPLYFPESVFVSRQDGVNVGHWNLHQCKIQKSDNKWICNGSPLICFHFSGFSIRSPEIISKHQTRWNFSNYPSLKLLFAEYASGLSEVNVSIKKDIKVYFVSDIFTGDRAGIYRYSFELAKRLLDDPSVDLRFIKGYTNTDINKLDLELKLIFGANVRVQRKFSLLGLFNYDFYKNNFIERAFLKARAAVSSQRNFHRIFVRELLRFILRLIRTIGFFKKRIEPESVLFVPYLPPSDGFSVCNSTLVVRVVHDIIPILHPEYFNSSEFFIKSMNDIHLASIIFTVSVHTKSDLIKHFPLVESSKVFPIPIAASEKFHPLYSDCSIREVKIKYDIPVDSDYVFTVCTIEPRKNHINLLKAWALAFNGLKLNNPKLVVAGRIGWGDVFNSELESLREDLGDSVLFTGFVEDEDLPLLYLGSRFSIYASLYEGFGIPVLESMCCGRFCLTSNVSSMPEITGDDVPLVNPCSVENITSQILLLANNSSYLSELECKALERSKLFSWNSTYGQTMDVLRDFIVDEKLP
tara:strand:- start:24898 stop:27036 length:2139 start_codon:yes stop_codon:yes gene_type:complete